VFFGATGDLAYKQIFPALQSMVRHGTLDVPVIGVAKAGWTLDQLGARARDSLVQHGGVDEQAFGKLVELLRYVDGDYQDPSTFQHLRSQLGDARRPLHYLAVPPALFETVVGGLAQARRACQRRALCARTGGRSHGASAVVPLPVHGRCGRVPAMPYLAFLLGLPASCGIVLFPVSPSSADTVARTALSVFESRTDWAGHFSVIEETRIRMTPLP